jgi:hypothetical protein
MRWILVFWMALVGMSLQAQQEQSCTEVRAMVRMARATSLAVLEKEKGSAGTGYRARTVYVFRRFDLVPRDHAAATAVLDLLPKHESDEGVFWGFDSSLCEGETDAEILALAGVEWRRAHDWARAAILLPERMADYVSYPLIVGLNPHDDYAVRMRRVCLAHPKELTAAIVALSAHDREWYLERVFNPQGCRTLGFPEAE